MLSEDFRENPGTLALTATWVLIFAAMGIVQWRIGFAVPPWWMPDPLTISTLTSHRFGDMTWLEVRQGQPWRLLTATFIHFGLIHLVLNGLAMISLGRLVEPWYRTGPFLAVCLIIGGLGNLVGGALRQAVALARPWLASQAATHHWPGLVERFLRGQGAPGVPLSIHTGGGSTILLGLITLAAVVGWRSKTRIGSHLQKQMILFLVLTAALGLAMSNLVDNYGHLGGAIVGVVIGLFDKPLFNLSDRKSFRVACWVFVVTVTGASFGSAAWHDRVETRAQGQRLEIAARQMIAESIRLDLERLYSLYARMTLRSPYLAGQDHRIDAVSVGIHLENGLPLEIPSTVTPEQVAQERVELKDVLARLDRTRKDLWGEWVAADLASLQESGRSALEEPPNYQQFYEFLVAWKPAFKTISADLAQWRAKHIEWEQKANQPR